MTQNPCSTCGTLSNNPRFCSRSCAARHNNSVKPKRSLKNKCKLCALPIKSYWVYCEGCRHLAPKSPGAFKDRGKERARGKECPTCGGYFMGDRRRRFCSKKCIPDAWRASYNEFVTLWLRGEIGGSRGTSVSNHIRRYLFEKYSSKCCECGWAKVNQASKRVPLHVDHIDGDWRNNAEVNLRLLCPNCHSLTPNYGSLNRGQGRPRT